MSRDELDQDKEYQQWQKTYKTTAVELPPQSIDSRILNAAHSAVDEVSDMGIDTAPVKRAWYVPVSYVAIVVISLSVVIKIGFEPEILQVPVEEQEPNNALPIESRSTQVEVQAMSADVSQPEKLEKKKSAEILHRNKQKMAKQKSVRSNEAEEIKVLKSLRESESVSSVVRKRSVDKVRISGEVKIPSAAAEGGIVDGQQQLQINNMLKLLESRQFENLKQALKAYRKIYGSVTGSISGSISGGISGGISSNVFGNVFGNGAGESKLPEPLLIWERENMPYSDK